MTLRQLPRFVGDQTPIFYLSHLRCGVLYINVVDIVKRDNKEGKMKSVLKGAAGALAVMAVALSAKGDVIIHGGCNILVWHPAVGVTSPAPMQLRDKSAEIAMLQNQIWRLRKEPEDARANLRVAIPQGTGWVTANMRVMTLMSEISNCERRIMQLR